MLHNDAVKTVEYMFPKYIEVHGGKDKLIKTLQSGDKKNESQDIKIKSLIIGEPSREVKFGIITYCVLPDSLVVEMFKVNFYMRSALIALSYDDGGSWCFATTADMKWLVSVLPDVAKLDIPKTTQPLPLGSNQKPLPLDNNAHTGTKYYLGRRAIALVVVTHNEEYLADSTSMKMVEEKWIKLTRLDAFTPNPTDTLKYGSNAVNGVDRYIIDDKKYPKAYSKIITMMRYVGPVDINIAEPN
ncbi:MAG TPA: hypothetical protein VGI43_03865 [Mucilaginibacter sp.]